MFRILYQDDDPHRGCFGNLADALQPFGIAPDDIPTAFNVFMNVQVDGNSGVISVNRRSVAPEISSSSKRRRIWWLD